ncbi:MAG TPA: hypothetical protein VMT27_02425 [Actinomycetes bacterium]|nr:hypothetical protein [Actinomycetes bacterium]
MPEPPVNVRLVLANNTEWAVDTVYEGMDADGVHQWRVINAPQALEVVGLKIDKLPTMTSVLVDAVEDQ